MTSTLADADQAEAKETKRSRAHQGSALNPAAWRVDELARDFKRLDTWRLAIDADASKGETFSAFMAPVVALGPATDSRAARALLRTRELVGQAFGWDARNHTLPIPGCRETSVSERLTEGDCAANRVAGLALPRHQLVDLKGIYLFEHEALLELNNRTIHALLHVAWVELPGGGGRHTPRLSVYVKSRGWRSDLYLALIQPFRHCIVYPAWTRTVARAWWTAHGR